MNPFTADGTAIPSNFGRVELIEKIKRRVVKDPPDLISLVGPRLYGKSVLLHHLAKLFNDGVDGYACATVITLQHRRPQSDAEFLQVLCESVRDALRPVLSYMAEILSDSDEASYFDNLKLVFENLEPSQKVLVLFDNFDRLPIGTGISPNLLDQLRELASLPTFAIVIASRQRLRDICNTEESRLSEFWELFRDPIDVGAFSKDSDWDAVWVPFEERGIKVEPGAKTELKNWTGGIPELVSAVLRQLYDDTNNGQDLKRETLVECAKTMVDCDSTGQLWDDMDTELQQEIAAGNVTRTHRREAEIRGVAAVSGDRSSLTCNIIKDHAAIKAPGAQELNQLFQSEDAYKKNMREVLKIRVAQVPVVDRALTEYVKKAIADLADDVPEYVFDRCRGIIEEAVRVIWKHEGLDGQTQLPQAWINTWTKSQGLDVPNGMNPLPTDRGEQVRVLRHIAGSTKMYFRVAGTVSRHSVMLLEQLNSAGNYRGHKHGENSRIGAACAMCFTGIELLESLAADLQAP